LDFNADAVLFNKNKQLQNKKINRMKLQRRDDGCQLKMEK